MDYKIVEKASFTVVGKAREFKDSVDGTENIPKFWGECKQNGSYGHLVNDICKGRPGVITGGESLGICVGGQEGFTYVIGVEKPEGIALNDLESFNIPAATWAVFSCQGPMPDSIQGLWKKIYEEWFPSTGYEQDYIIPDFEVYMSGDMDSDRYCSQIWIPIVKNRK